ncbi:sigma-70 family RNA polymerase sigma factor [Saccharibacillus alkalitolerans]|uniref:Sigma-70 family RNA polymerase sigma factor n=1 Tax=Saccharibacillus alkalitolerans TaxID=2705290 RepID=A0ABX0FA94_9BACL|nr:sigma-70 family RNA polymerase sigma factor [Saccharibacillus alkalitolerans]NGZ76394.1 sigma-70 family RNA polymerase sigma factor [Saccharibacillus alkalitolerans]
MKEWVEQARRGNAEACERIFRRFSGMAYAAAYEKTRDAHLAEDVVQEAFAEAFAGLEKLENAEAFPGWLRTIVIRKAGRLLRRKRIPVLPIGEAAEAAADEGADTAKTAELRELRSRLYDSVGRLPSGQRDAVRLYYFEGYPVRDIAAFLGVSESALKKRLFDARNRLRSALHVADFSAAFRDLHEGGKNMLHIVNGDHTAKLVREAGIEGEVLVWRELYPFGPAFADMEEASARFARADVLERELGIPRSVYLDGCAEQERRLRELERYEEAVLWFEHDLFDQTMLALLLNRIGRAKSWQTRVSLLCIGEFPGIEVFHGLGQLRAEQLKTLSGTWQPAGSEQFELASRFWAAYSSPDPEEHVRFLEADSAALPFARAAFEAHLSRLPSAEDGLGSIQRAVLEAAASGAAGPIELFRRSTDKLVALGLGDLEFWRHLERMAAGPSPLLSVSGEGAFPKYGRAVPDFGNRKFAPSELGRRILAGEAAAPADAAASPEWAGGLRLAGASPLRWDAPLRRIAEPNS